MSGTIRCMTCGYVNRVTRYSCRNCGQNLPAESDANEGGGKEHLVLPENLSNASIKTAAWMREQIVAHGNRAREITQKVRCLRKGIYHGLSELSELLDKADALLVSADEEFRERVYAPFWDAVEGAALSLGTFNATLVLMGANVSSYERLLTHQTHNFPPFAIRQDDVPNPARQIERFRQLVRVGQRDFEFATIWEHRKTRKTILEGFHTLGEAVNNLVLTSEDSWSGVTKAIEASSNRLQEEEIRLREAFEEALSEWEEQKRLYG